MSIIDICLSHELTNNDKYNKVKKLLESGGNINEQDIYGYTALMILCNSCYSYSPNLDDPIINMELIELLIENNIDIKIQAYCGESIFDIIWHNTSFHIDYQLYIYELLLKKDISHKNFIIMESNNKNATYGEIEIAHLLDYIIDKIELEKKYEYLLIENEKLKNDNKLLYEENVELMYKPDGPGAKKALERYEKIYL